MPKPVFSIIIPVYNAAEVIKDTIHSICIQNYVHKNIIVVNDGSTDGTIDIITKTFPSITILNKSNWGGPSQARNMGFKYATGDIILFQDQDDHLYEGVLGTVADQFLLSPSDQIVHVQVQEKFKHKCILAEPSHKLQLGTYFMRRAVIERVGAFDESLKVADDFDFLDRIKQLSIPIRKLKALGLIYHKHDQSLGHESKASISELFSILRKKT